MIDSDIIDLSVVRRSLLRHWPRIIGIAVFVGLITAFAIALLAKYRSEGVYTLATLNASDIASDSANARTVGTRDIPTDSANASSLSTKVPYHTKGMNLQQFKTEYPQLDWERFVSFLTSWNVAIDREIERTRTSLSNGDLRQEMLIPLYGSTRADLREFGEQSKLFENPVLGFRIVVDGTTGGDAYRIVRLLGDFSGETTFRSQADALIAKRLETNETQALSLANDLISTRFTMAQMAEKSARFRGIRKEFPEVSDSAARQVVSTADGGSRYLSPSAQLVGIESSLADQRQRVATVERLRRKAELLAKFYGDARQLGSAQQTSAAFLAGMAKLVDTSFVKPGEPDDVSAEARNDALLDLHALRVFREEGLRFVSGPTTGKRDETRIWKYGLIAALAAALAGMVITPVLSSRDPDRKTI